MTTVADGKRARLEGARAAEIASFHNYHKTSQCSAAPHYRLDIAFYSSFPRCRAETEETDSLRQAIISTASTAKKPKLMDETYKLYSGISYQDGDVVISSRPEPNLC